MQRPSLRHYYNKRADEREKNLRPAKGLFTKLNETVDVGRRALKDYCDDLGGSSSYTTNQQRAKEGRGPASSRIVRMCGKFGYRVLECGFRKGAELQMKDVRDLLTKQRKRLRKWRRRGK